VIFHKTKSKEERVIIHRFSFSRLFSMTQKSCMYINQMRERKRERVSDEYVYRLEYIPFGADQDRRRKNCFKHSNRV